MTHRTTRHLAPTEAHPIPAESPDTSATSPINADSIKAQSIDLNRPRSSRLAFGLVAAALAATLALVGGCGSTVDGTGQSPTTAPVTTSAASSVPSSPAPSSSAAAAQPDACTLLTPAEAQALAGTPLLAPVAAGGGAGMHTLCQYAGPTTGPVAQVEVFVGDGAKKQLDIDRENLKHTFTTVPGVGDQCVQEDDFIFVEKNGLWASISLVLLNDPKQNVVPMQTAIKLVAARMP